MMRASRFGRVSGVLAVVGVMAAGPLVAGTYTWDGGGADNNWSTGGNWSPDGSVPLSASDTLVKLDGTNRVNTAQDVAAPFTLNRLEFLNAPYAGGKPAINLSGGALRFEANGATQPRVYLSRQASCTLANNVEIPAGTTLSMEFTTYGLSFNGVISGGGSIDKLRTDGGLDLRNAANSFSGGLTVRASNKDWLKVTVYASGAMGTGPVTLDGGTISTNFAFPGGLIFSGTTAHTNALSLLQDSPLFAEMPAGSSTVALSGPVALGSSALYLRGGGSGTLSGAVSGGGTNALVKLDQGTWTLAGANTYTGRVVVNRGTLTLSGSTAAGAVTVNNGTFNGTGTLHVRLDGAAVDKLDVNGGTLDIRSLKIDFDVGAGGLPAGDIVVVDYADGGTLSRNAAPYFASVTDLPAGYELMDDAAGKRLLLVRTSVTVWDGGGADNNWSSVTNWTGDAAAPASSSNTTVKFDGLTRLSPLQDLGSPFLLNRLEFLNGPSAGVKAAFNLDGGALRVAPNSAGIQPRLYLTREANCVVANALEIPGGATLALEIGTWGVNLTGVVSGEGGLDKLENAGGLSLFNGANSFSGGLTVRAVDGDWYKVNVYASGALGTGPVRLYGGTLNTARADPGGLAFFNTTRHTNDIALFKHSPIFAGMPNVDAAVTLTGNIDLNPTNTLTLRGAGRGVIEGAISEGAATALSKVDSGCWTLSGANSFTGGVAVRGGALALGAAAALPAGAPLALAGGTLDLGGFAVASGPLSIGSGQLLNGALSAAAYACTGTGVVAVTLGGSAGLTKSGAGTLTLRGAQAFTGPLVVGGGTVELQGAPAAGSALWLDAASLWSLYRNADGSGGAPTSGAVVSRWVSLSGNNWASNTGSQPTYLTNMLNGLPVLRFYGKSLNLASNVAAQGSTVFIVYRDGAPTGTWRNPLDSVNQTPTSGWLHMLNNLNNRCLTKGGGAVYLDSPESATDWAVQTMRLEAGNYRLWVNENAYGPSTATAEFTPFTAVSQGGLSADFAEILVYTNLLADAARVDTIRYLQRKWLGEGDGGSATNRLPAGAAASVAAGATLDLCGGTQSLASLAGGGTVTGGAARVTGLLSAGDAAGAAGELAVRGDLALAAGATNAVDYVAGLADIVQVSGTLTVEGAGTVALALNGQEPPQQTTLLTFGALAGAENLALWSVEGAGLEAYEARVKAVDNRVVLSIYRRGLIILLQ